MFKTGTTLVTIFTLIFLSAEAPSEDRVHLPVANYSVHKWYSGYLNISTGDYHYVFFDSQRDPDNDPVILWLNGGPGCSSLIGMAKENGPFVLEINKMTFKINQYAWNMKANLLYIESPGGVGFSKSSINNSYSDQLVAQDNYNALMDFYRKFPNLKNNEFFIAGQSYAGIYIPYLASLILKKNKLPQTEMKINLKGILIGNGCTDPRECYQPAMFGQDGMSIYQYEFLYNHNYITDKDYLMLTGSCILGYHSSQCKQLRKNIDAKFYATMTVINNIYQPCYHQIVPDLPKKLQSRRSVKSTESCEDILGIYHFFNEPQMYIHLHVDPIKWDLCSDDVANKYQMNENASLPLYPDLIKSGLRIWIYSGDVDANVPILGTLRWLHLMKDLEGLGVIQPWRQWWVHGLHKHEDQMAGNVYKLKGLTFLSVKGAGHMVPTNKPAAAAVMLEAFITGNDLPYKTP